MCGRFSLTHSSDALENVFSVAGVENFPPRYNIAPTQPIMTISAGLLRMAGSNLPEQDALLMRWGLLPSWVKDPSDFPLLINARSETAATKASFRNAMRHRRILIPASGFYEWQRDKETGQSQAYWVRPKDGELIGFAGLAETYMNKDGAEIDTAAFLTAPSNKQFQAIHHRMPIAIAETDFKRWLDCRTQEPRHIADLLRAPDEDFFEAIAVSDLVNKVSNTSPENQKHVTPKDFTQKKKPKPIDDSQGSLF
ncbi:SOS response-associated peptidase [Ahrensia kielensis]|uniref:SOS response-associated peptidase n=1 Tax=Ahrensia kielensis TaxID=76980 RepID=UPI0003774324|nr:SOS response-associated peptidase [Ahrensia kielensis]